MLREPGDGPFGWQFTLTDLDGNKINIYERDQPLLWRSRRGSVQRRTAIRAVRVQPGSRA